MMAISLNQTAEILPNHGKSVTEAVEEKLRNKGN
jgi:hypothetical protein